MQCTDILADKTPIHTWGKSISGFRKIILKFQLSLMIFLVLLPFSEIFQRPLWNMNRELGLLPFPQQPVLESPQLAEKDPNCSSPVSCHRLHDHAFDFSRTRNIQDGTEGTWSPSRRKSEQRLKLVNLLPQNWEEKSAFAFLFASSYIWPHQHSPDVCLGLYLAKRR